MSFMHCCGEAVHLEPNVTRQTEIDKYLSFLFTPNEFIKMRGGDQQMAEAECFVKRGGKQLHSKR